VNWSEYLTAERYAPWFFERVFDVPYGAGVSGQITPELLDNPDANVDIRYGLVGQNVAYQGEGVVRDTWLLPHVLEENGSLKNLKVLRTPHLSDAHFDNTQTLSTVGCAPYRSVFRKTARRTIYSTYQDDPHPRELSSLSEVIHPRDLFDPRGRTIVDNIDVNAAGELGALFRV
jgi:hypothetical protein